MQKRIRILLIALPLAAAAAGAFFGLSLLHLTPEKAYTAKDFGIATARSRTDKNRNGVDDYTDILLGARAYVETKPKYRSAYYAGGYPPDGEGVCTDVIWKAFQNAGYNLKDLVDADIAQNRSSYPDISAPDKNIDFRRVRNLRIFFQRNARSQTTDPNAIKEWQPGDIVVYTNHIAVLSDKRNKNGRPYIIHNSGSPVYEADALTGFKIVGHYRWEK